MTIAKTPMSNSYKAVFVFSILMVFISLLGGSKGGVGTLFWGYTAWMMHKKNIAGLVALFKLSLVLVAFCSIIGILYVGNGTFEEKWLGYTVEGFYLTIFIIGAIDLALVFYFKNLISQNNSSHDPSSASVPSMNHSQLLSDLNYVNAPHSVATKKKLTKVSLVDEQINPQTNDDFECWHRALQEFDSSFRHQGLWAKCYAENEGDENKAKAAYLRSRAASIKIYQDDKANQIRKEIECPECLTKYSIIAGKSTSMHCHNCHFRWFLNT